jgi:oligopeptidase B
MEAENNYAKKFIDLRLAQIHSKITDKCSKFYFTHIEGEQNPIVDVIDGYRYFRSGDLHLREKDGRVETVLDESLTPEGFQLSNAHISPNHNLVAFLEKRIGEEHGVIRIKNLENGLFLTETIQNVVNFLWHPSRNDTIIFTTLNAIQLRPDSVRFRQLDDISGCSKLLFHEADSSFLVDVSITKDKKYLLVTSSSKTSSEIMIHQLQDSILHPSKLVCIEKRRPNHEYFLDHHDGKFYILTNYFSSWGDFQLVIVNSSNFGIDRWKPVDFLKGDHIVITDTDIFKDHLIVYATISMRPYLIDYNPVTNEALYIPLPEFSTLTPGVNRDFKAKKCRFNLCSLWCLESIYEYCFEEKSLKLIRNVTIGDPNNFEVSLLKSDIKIVRIKVSSENIPVTIVFNKAKSNLKEIMENLDDIDREDHHNFRFDDNAKSSFPCLLIAYGCYGINNEVLFEPALFTLLEEGWILCFAHLKGGSEYGKNWYNQGRHLKKEDTVNSLVEIARYFEERWCKGKVCGYGTSAGGLVMGSALIKGIQEHNHSYKSLFNTCILTVPFLDPLSAMLDKKHPLTTTEIEEWGDPAVCKQDFECISRYSPFENIPSIQSTNYKMPNIWISTGLKDQRVPYWHGLKFSAKMRNNIAAYEKDTTLLCLTHPDFGHNLDEDKTLWISFLIYSNQT